MARLQNGLLWKQINKQIGAAQQGSKHDNMMNEKRRQQSRGQKKRKLQVPFIQRSQYHTQIVCVYYQNRACIL